MPFKRAISNLWPTRLPVQRKSDYQVEDTSMDADMERRVRDCTVECLMIFGPETMGEATKVVDSLPMKLVRETHQNILAYARLLLQEPLPLPDFDMALLATLERY